MPLIPLRPLLETVDKYHFAQGCTVCLLIASLVWFHGWEGGKNSE